VSGQSPRCCIEASLSHISAARMGGAFRGD
jgi:hypothetical protein